jgi:hypothetical protein
MSTSDVVPPRYPDPEYTCFQLNKEEETRRVSISLKNWKPGAGGSRPTNKDRDFQTQG